MERRGFDSLARPVVLLAAAVGVFVGWRLFWFLTDDAFIAFRYISNSMEGFGLVWNPAPFRPVEGYTSLLWILLLRSIWAVTGIEPPQAANVLSLLFGYGTLYFGWRFVERMTLPKALARDRVVLLAIVLLGTITNRTFLAWLSSGLETALFNFLLTAWLYCGLTPLEQRGRFWTRGLSLTSAAIALTRPDGLLFFAAGLVLLFLHFRDSEATLRGNVTGLFSLLLLPLHLFYRRWTYGEWLPNTYYAKHVGAWPESGLRYLASFILEYGLWIWLALLVLCLKRGQTPLVRPKGSVPCIAVAAVVLHFAYYTFVIGGDHFEYRVYSHLVLLLFISAVWLVGQVTTQRRTAYLLLAALVVASWPIPWVHWSETRERTTRGEAYMMVVPIAAQFPQPFRTPVAWWDGLQAWLIDHHVGTRHQEHKVFYEWQKQAWRPREEGLLLEWDDRWVMPWDAVGVPGWVLPHVAIVDSRGLNDHVIARSAVDPAKKRSMAHDRTPPPGYIDCFRPNVTKNRTGLRLTPREQPLTDAEIRACESRDW